MCTGDADIPSKTIASYLWDDTLACPPPAYSVSAPVEITEKLLEQSFRTRAKPRMRSRAARHIWIVAIRPTSPWRRPIESTGPAQSCRRGYKTLEWLSGSTRPTSVGSRSTLKERNSFQNLYKRPGRNTTHSLSVYLLSLEHTANLKPVPLNPTNNWTSG